MERSLPRSRAAVLLVIATLCAASGAARADSLQAGVDALARGDLALAGLRLDEAIAHDPGSAEAHYFRAQVSSRLGEHARAAQGFERATEIERLFAEAWLSAGLARYELGERERARGHLEKASELVPESPEAALFLGILAEEGDELREARKQYERAQTLDPGGDTGERASQRLAALRGPDGDSPQTGRRFGIGGSAGLEYDSDVAVSDVDSSTGNGDGAGVFELGGWIRAYQAASDRVTLGYDLFQSLHFDLEEFDLRTHLLTISGEHTLDERFDLGFDYAFTRVVLGGDRLYDAHALSPSLGMLIRSLAYLRASYTYQRRGFVSNHPVSGAVNDRDADRHRLALRAHAPLPAPFARFSLGYSYDIQDARGGAFDYRAHVVATNLRFGLPTPWDGHRSSALLDYRFEARDYDVDREDGRHVPRARLEVEVVAPLVAWLDYAVEFSDSTLPELDFTAHRFGVGLAAEY